MVALLGKGVTVRSPWAVGASAALLEHPFSLGHGGLRGFAERDGRLQRLWLFREALECILFLTPVIIATESSISCSFYSWQTGGGKKKSYFCLDYF